MARRAYGADIGLVDFGAMLASMAIAVAPNRILMPLLLHEGGGPPGWLRVVCPLKQSAPDRCLSPWGTPASGFVPLAFFVSRFDAHASCLLATSPRDRRTLAVIRRRQPLGSAQ